MSVALGRMRCELIPTHACSKLRDGRPSGAHMPWGHRPGYTCPRRPGSTMEPKDAGVTNETHYRQRRPWSWLKSPGTIGIVHDDG